MSGLPGALVLPVSAATALAVSVAVLLVYGVFRRRWKKDEMAGELDANFDAAMNEMNKMGALIRQELDEKHKEALFLYNLMADRMEEMEAKRLELEAERLEINARLAEMQAPPRIPGGEKPGEAAAGDADGRKKPPKHEVRGLDFGSRIASPTHRAIAEKWLEGKDADEIAREMGLGRGEVKFVLDIARKAKP